jgi:hypothetical protein
MLILEDHVSHCRMLCWVCALKVTWDCSVCLRIRRRLLQPLDGILLKPFKIFYQQEATAFSCNNPNTSITKYDFVKLIITAENKFAIYGKYKVDSKNVRNIGIFSLHDCKHCWDLVVPQLKVRRWYAASMIQLMSVTSEREWCKDGCSARGLH